MPEERGFSTMKLSCWPTCGVGSLFGVGAHSGAEQKWSEGPGVGAPWSSPAPLLSGSGRLPRLGLSSSSASLHRAAAVGGVS